MQERGLSASTVKTDLAAIRFWHDQIPQAKYALPANSEYALERRKFGGVDRTWSDAELAKMIHACQQAKREDYEACILIARYAGLRLHEVMRLDTAMAKAALESGFLTIKGKGGKIRDVPMGKSVRVEFTKFLGRTRPGHKLFVSDGKQTHIAMTELQNFIGAHRGTVQEDAVRSPLTFHGLRHTCAAEWYKALIADGETEYEARLQVSRWLGHERDDVTRIYLASINRKE